MAVERNLVFVDGKAYSISDTMAWITRMYEQSDQTIFPDYRFENIMAILIDYKYLIHTSAHWIPCPHDGTTLLADIWWKNYGMLDHTIEYLYAGDLESITVDTMPLSNDPDIRGMEWENLHEEEIEDDYDEDFWHGIRNVADSIAETQDIDELYHFGHDTADIEQAIDDFMCTQEFGSDDSDKEN